MFSVKMGVDNLLPFICRHAAAAVTHVGHNLTSLAGSRVAVDVPIQMHRAVNVKGTDDCAILYDWFNGLHKRLTREHLTPVYVFDGAKVEAKSLETAKRTEALVKAGQRATMARARFQTLQSAAMDLESVLGLAYSSAEGMADLMTPAAAVVASTATLTLTNKRSRDEFERESASELEPERPAPRLRVATPLEDLARAGEDLRKAETRLIKPQSAHYDAVRAYLSGIGARCIVAPTEAEKECAKLCADGEVDVVVTDDSDSLPFGAPRVLFQYGRDKAYVVELAGVLAALGMTLETFRNFCVLCGCDFVGRVPTVGPAKAYPMIKEHHTIAAVLERRAAARDPRFAEDVIAARLANAVDEVAVLETQVAEVQEDMHAVDGMCSPIAATQLGALAARLDFARKTVDDERKQLHGLAEFKKRYPVALAIFTEPDARPAA